ncbi:MAG: EthD family reductase [Actinomycetota bacterium]|nr:EthD family reductase [Actinomycetota bacterium]
MTVQMYVLYRTPENPEAFEKRYVEGHLPLIKAYDNVKDVSFAKVTRRVMGEFPYDYVFTGTWSDKDAWKADLGSQKAKDATADAQSFAPPFDVVVLETLA